MSSNLIRYAPATNREAWPAACHAQITAVSKIYKSRNGAPVNALTEVNLAIERNEFLCLIGPSGCGKSTLLKIFAGLIRPTSGRIIVNHSDPSDVAGSIMGIVFQTPVLFPWKTILRNVMFPAVIQRADLREAGNRAMSYLEMAGLTAFAASYPCELSGGMQQRASICRALMCRSDILLMDEPFGALDALTRDDMAVELKRISAREKKTVIFVTHSIPEAVFLGDRIVVMSARPGRINSIVDVGIEGKEDIAVMGTVRFQSVVADIRSRIEAQKRGGAVVGLPAAIP
jgi:NitT/TauT family transport system ATP-binding protein